MQVSRLGNPLFNEVIVPMGKKDRWNATHPAGDCEFAQYVKHPELARLLPVLYPGVFPNLASLNGGAGRPRRDPAHRPAVRHHPGFQNFTGTTLADMLRLNVAIPPTDKPNPLGLLGGDLAGFPNGRRVSDDVVTIELRAIAGVTYPLVNPELHARRGCLRGQREPDAGSRPLPGELPVPRHPARRLRHSLVVAVT